MFDIFKKKSKAPEIQTIEEMLLESLSNDVWLITQATSAGHFHLTRNGIQLRVATDEKRGWIYYSATVNEQKLSTHDRVGLKCSQLVEEKFGKFDLQAMVKKELD